MKPLLYGARLNGKLNPGRTRRHAAGARRFLFLCANPYVTDADIIQRIIATAKRGVKVRIVTSQTSNNPAGDCGTQALLEPDRRHFVPPGVAGMCISIPWGRLDGCERAFRVTTDAPSAEFLRAQSCKHGGSSSAYGVALGAGWLELVV
jgi:hypothetical protein